MEIRPILSAMLRSKTGPVLIALLAITLAIVVNSAFIINQRLEHMHRPTGMDHENLVFARSYGFGPNHDTLATIREDIDALLAMPGVRNAAYISGIPLSGSGSNSGFLPHPPEGENDPDSTNANYYNGDHRLAEALGLKIIRGPLVPSRGDRVRSDRYFLRRHAEGGGRHPRLGGCRLRRGRARGGQAGV